MITELIGNKEIKKNYIFNPLCFGSSRVEVLFEKKLFLTFIIKG